MYAVRHKAAGAGTGRSQLMLAGSFWVLTK